MRKSEAKEPVKQAYAVWDAEEWQRAADLYEQVLAHFPDEKPSAEWWYDAALGHKFLRNWGKAYELGVQAAARAPRGEGDPAYWNLGIAATIRRDWATARDAWSGSGFELPDGEGEITATSAWPASAWTPTANARSCGWNASARPAAVSSTSSPTTASERNPPAASRPTCACCNEGTIHKEQGVHAGTRRVLLAAPEDEARRLLDRWAGATAVGRSWSGLEVMDQAAMKPS